MNPFERSLAVVFPGWALRRAHARLRVEAAHRAYEAADPGRMRQRVPNFGSGNAAVANSALPLRNIARHIERNHDIGRGVLDVLVRNTIGASGIGTEPQPRNRDGSINTVLADQIADLHSDWCEAPEVTGEHHWRSAQRLLARSWFRDGESLFQHVAGAMLSLDHNTVVPYSIEMIECDLLPLDFDDPSVNCIQGVERDLWGRPRAYHLYKQHPGDPNSSLFSERKRVAAQFIGHLKAVDRIGQVRGVSLYASVLSRLEDLKDYEESERIAAKIAASMAAYIKKGQPEDYNAASYCRADGTPLSLRAMQFRPGMVFDDLRPGEEIGMIDSQRPNPNAATWRDGQLRAVSAGTGTSYSSTSKNYNGTYSAQRQELVEQYMAYAILSDEFINRCARPVYQRFLSTAIQTGKIKLPAGIHPINVYDAQYIAPAMPWIDPLKELAAFEIAEDRAYMSGPEIIRRRGGNPGETARQQAAWLELKKELELFKPDDPRAINITEVNTA